MKAWVLLLLLVPGCAGLRPETPTATVEAYFRYLKSDPGRLLPLLTPEFHDRHGLSMAALKGWLWGDYVYLEPIERQEPIDALAPVDAERGRDANEFAWLQVQVEGRLRAAAQVLEPSLSAPDMDGDSARIEVKVRPPQSFGFVQVFELKEGPDGSWRIDAIEQRGVQRVDVLSAFAAHPNAALLPALRALSKSSQRL